MHWNPYIELRCQESRAVRAACKQCGAPIERGTLRVEAVDVLSRKELWHVDCAVQRAPDLCRRKVIDKDPEWPQEGLEVLSRFLPEGVTPAPRSYQRTPILDLSYDKDALGKKPCLFCGDPAPDGSQTPNKGHAVRAFSIDGERRFHPECIVQLAPGLCKRVVGEDSERWPAEVKAFWAQVIPPQITATPRSPWKNTGGIPELQRSPSGRAACRFCSQKIAKGELRLARQQVFGMRKSPVYFHVGCYAKSDDYHPRMLELVVLRAPEEISREEIEAWRDVLPPEPEEDAEDEDVQPLLERLLTLYDHVAAARQAKAEQREAETPQLTENVVEIPEGFFST